MEPYKLCVFILFVLNVPEEMFITAQDINMIHYIERRILALEDRLSKCEQDIQQNALEYRELAHKLLIHLEGFSRYKTEAKNEMDNLLARVERAEWDIDYLETTASSNTCLEVDEQLVEKQEAGHEEEQKRIGLKLNTSCANMLENIKSQKTVKRVSSHIGSWMRNAANQSDSQKIFFFHGDTNNTFLEFANIEDFTSTDYMQRAESRYLPFFWQGTGHAVYDNFLFVLKNGTANEIVKYDWQKNVTQSLELSGAGEIAPYQLSPFTKIDLAVDEQGLWTIHADPNNDGYIVLTKIDYNHMVVEHAWNTSCESTNAESAFVICGTLYVIYNSPNGGRSHIDCVYDTSDLISIHQTPTLYFPKRYSHHSSVHYNPQDQTLYAWDEGYQTLYKFDTKEKM